MDSKPIHVLFRIQQGVPIEPVQGDRMMHYILYRTTCLKSGRIYIGAHETMNLGDGYLGSGNLLIKSIRKYGREHFRKDIIAYTSSREEMYALEAEIVNSKFLNRKDVYNARPGGVGGFLSSDKAKEFSLLGKATLAEKMKDPSFRDKVRIKQSEGVKKFYSVNPPTKGFLGGKHTDSAKKNIGLKNSSLQKGDGNSNYGKVWMFYSGQGISKPFPSGDISRQEELGWVKGRRIKLKGDGTAWGGHFACTEESSRNRFPDPPPINGD